MLAVVTAAYLTAALPAAWADEPEAVVLIEGTGDCQALLRALAEAYRKHNPSVRVEVPDTVGTTGGLRALTQGKCDLARIARPLTDAEIQAGLAARPFVAGPLAFIVNAANTGVFGVTAAQAAAAYSGRLDSFAPLGGPDGKLYPLSREPADSLFKLVAAAVPGFGQGDFTHARVYYTSQELIADTAAQPLALGFTSLIEASGETKVRAISFEQVAPTPANMRNGSYPLRLVFFLAWRADASKATRDFLAFTQGEQASAVIEAMGGTACGDHDQYCK